MPAKRTGQSTQVRTRSANWTDALDVILLRALKEQQLVGNCVGGQVKKEAWEEVVPTFNRESGVNLGKSHLKNRLKVLKTAYCLYSTLASRSGWDWDYVRNIPKPESSSDWETAIAENPKYAKCKDRPFQAYKDLEVLCGNTVWNHDTAIMLDDDGSGDDTSRASPGDIDGAHTPGLNLNMGAPSSSIVRPIRAARLTTLDLPSAVPTQLSPIGSSPNHSNPQTPLNECPVEERDTRFRKRQRYSPSAPCTCKAVPSGDTKVLSELVEIGRQCLQIARELLNRDPVVKPKVYSMEECIEKLNGLPNLSNEAMLAALEALKDKDNRIIFTGLKGPLLSAWINKQVVLQSQLHPVVDK